MVAGPTWEVYTADLHAFPVTIITEDKVITPELVHVVCPLMQGVLAAFDAEAEFLSLTTRGSVILRSSLLPLQQALLELDDHARVLSVHERICIVEQCVKECEGVAAGSSLHVVLAARLAALSRGLYGQGSPAARQAELRCAQAHVARYSADLSVAVLGALVKHHELQAMGTALAAQINVLAWDVATSDGNLSRGMGIDRTPET